MRKVLILCLTFISAALFVRGQQPIIPITIGNVLIGGSQNGRWLNDLQTVETVKPHTIFNAFNKSEPKKPFTLYGTIARTSEVCGIYYLFFSENDYAPVPDEESWSTEDGPKPAFALGANATWNAFPRIPKEVDLSSGGIAGQIATYLKGKGISKTSVVVTDAFKIDLDGDRTDEMVISATYFRDMNNIEERSAGDYSFTIVQRQTRMGYQNILLSGEFFVRKGNEPLELIYPSMYPTPSSPAVSAIADLNGDGVMEIILHGTDIFAVDGGRVRKVLEGDSCLN